MANKYQVVTSPRGTFIYPHLTEPDTKFVKPDGEYHTKFALPADEQSTTDFIAAIDAELDRFIEENPKELTKAAIKKALRADHYEEEVDEEGEETGRLIFKFKLKAKVETKNKTWEQKPRLFDSKAQPIVKVPNIWTGSEGKVNVELFPYYMASSKTFGVSLRCIGVQLLKLVEGGDGGAAGQGFGAEDDGYVANDSGFEPDDDDGDDDAEF